MGRRTNGWVCGMVLGCVFAAAGSAAADTYEVDPVHSSVVFRIQHGGVAYVYGRFNEFEGRFQYDPSAVADSSFELDIRAASVDTANQRRDDHLRSPDFFNARQFPRIHFATTEVAPAGEEGRLEVTGDLTLHGVTNPITFQLEHTGSADLGRMGYRTGFEARFTIQRSDFGMDFMIDNGMLGDEVTLMVAVQGVRQ